MPNGSKLKLVNSYLAGKPTKYWKGIGEKDSIVPAGVQLTLHHPCAEACEQRASGSIIVLSSNGNHLNLVCRAAGTRQEAGAWWFSPDFVLVFWREYAQAICRFRIYSGCGFSYLDFSIFSIPKLFVDSAYILGSWSVWQTYTSMLLANNAIWIQIEVGQFKLWKENQKIKGRGIGEKDSIVPAGAQLSPTSSVCSVRASVGAGAS